MNNALTIKIGTIHELTGQGLEIMVDVPTRSIVLAQFFNGKMVRENEEPADPYDSTAVALGGIHE